MKKVVLWLMPWFALTASAVAGPCTTPVTFLVNSGGSPATVPFYTSNISGSNDIGCIVPTDSTGTILFPNVAAAADATANPSITQIGTMLFGFNGTSWDRIGESGGVMKVSDPSNAPTHADYVTPGNAAIFEVSPTTTANLVTNPFFSEISDGTRAATIKAGSTAAVVGDTSIVVQLSPAQPNLNAALNVSSSPLAIGTWGIGATGVAVPANAVSSGGRGESTEPTAVADGQEVARALDVTGRTIVLPYAPKELMKRDKLTAASTTVTSTVFTAVASVKNYVTAAQCYRTDAGATVTTATFNDTAASVVPVPPTSGAIVTFEVPLVTAAATALTLTSTVSNVVCSIQGFQAQ